MKERIVTILCAVGLLNIGVAIWAGVKYGPHAGVMCALGSHLMFATCKILMR